MTASLPARLQTALAGRYAINRPLGEGGMGVVFHATDLKHDRPVAIKVLRTDAAEALSTERFLREIRIAAQLDHPHILMLIDSGEADGLLYYVMPFVEGESLRGRLLRTRPLPVAEALQIAAQVADALDHAHRLGVVHRDVKPENILLSGSHVKLADFGIARVRAGTQAPEPLTQTGIALGTPAYMSPEQFFGDADLDHRSDLYSLACVLYEMLTGAAPFAGEAVTKRLVEDAPRVTNQRPAVPPMIDMVLARALAREPQARHATLAEFGAALQAELSGSRTAVAPVDGTASALRTAFVGRERELAEAQVLLAGLPEGRGGLLLIGGEPGVGKTSLANAVLDEARRRKALCLVGRCYEMEGMPPFTPYAEVLDYVSRLVPVSTFRELLGDSAAEISRVQPLLRERFDDIPLPLDLPPDRQRALLHAHYRAFNERAARVAPIVVLFDDLHWADESSLALLEHAATYLSALPIVAIGTYRDTDLDVQRPFARTLETLARLPGVRRLALRRLPIDATRELLTALGGGAPPDSLVALLHRDTDGNPFFVQEVFKHLREEGKLFDGQGRWLATLDVETLDVPEGVRLVVGRRLQRLSESCRTVLLSGAVIGSLFDVDVLEALGEVSEEVLFDAIEEAVRAGLLREQKVGRMVRYAFSHELIRQTLLGQLSMPRRQRRHLRVAQAMVQRYGAQAAAHANDLAYHFYQAGSSADDTDTVRWLVEAARQALERGANQDAFDQCERALGVLEPGQPNDYEGALHLYRARSLRGLGRWDEVVGALQSALSGLKRTGEHQLRVEAAWDAFTPLMWAGRYAECAALLDDVLATTPNAMHAERGTLLLLRAGGEAMQNPQWEHVDPLIVSARVLLENSPEQLQAFGLMAAYTAIHAFGCINEILANCDRAEALLRESRRRTWLADLAGCRMYAIAYGGRLDLLDAYLDDAYRLAEETGHRGSLAYADMAALFAQCAKTLDLDDTRTALLAWAEEIAALGPWGALVVAVTAYLDLQCGREGYTEAQLLESRVQLGENFQNGWHEGTMVLRAAYTDPDHARVLLDCYQSLLTTEPRTLWVGRTTYTALVVEAAVVLGDLPLAASLLPPLEANLARGLRTNNPLLLLDRTAGVAAAAGGAWETATAHFEAALAWSTRHGAEFIEGDTRRWYAWMLARRAHAGDRDAALAHLDRADDIMRRAGAHRVVREIAALRETLA